MENKNELDDFLKRNLQFDANEMPEPDPRIQKKLRKRVERNKTFKSNRFMSALVQFLTMDIKLYHAGIAIAAVSIIFLALRHTTETPAHFGHHIIVADTNTGTSLKEEGFLVKNFSTTIN